MNAGEQLILNQSGDNDLHLVAYVPPENKEEAMKKLKTYRKFNTKNTDRFFHVKFWFVGDAGLAESLKIDTSESAIGDVYLLRPKSVFNLGKPNIVV